MVGTDGHRSFSLFLYEDIQWTTGDDDGGTDGLGGYPAIAGFIDAGRDCFLLPYSGRDSVTNLRCSSNLAEDSVLPTDGMWLYRIDGPMITGWYSMCSIALQIMLSHLRVQEVQTKAEVVPLTLGLQGLGVLFNCHP